MSLSARIINSMILGILLGLFIGENTLAIQWIGEVWIRLMQMTVLPYVIFSLISGVGSLDIHLAKTLAIRGGLLLLLFWFVSAIVIFAMPLAFPQWQDASFFSSNVTHAIKPFNPIEIYIPKNPFNAMANSTVPAVVLFCLAVGVALITHKDKSLLVDSFKVFTDVLAKVMGFMVQLTPIGVFSIVAVSAGTMTTEQLTHLEVYFIVYIAASLLLTFIVLPLLISMLTPFKYRDIMHFSRSSLLTGFVAQNVFIILPMLIEDSKRMKEILANPGIKHKFVKGLQSIPGVVIYRKSGSWRNFHADSALVEYGEHKYIIIGLSDSKSGGDWLTRLAESLHKLIVKDK